MKMLPILMACVAIAGSARPGAAQVEMPTPIPEAPTAQGCPSFNTSQPSAAAWRCNALSRTGDMLDGGTHLYTTFGGLGGRDSAFEEKQNLGASFQGAVVYAGLVSAKSKSFDLFENTASGMDYRTTQQTLQYLDTTAVSLTHLPSERTIVSFDAYNIFGNDAIRILDLSGATTSAADASYGIDLGRVLDDQATLQVSRQSTETRWWSVTLRNNFRDLIDLGSSVNTAHARAEMQFQPSSRAGIGAFEETDVESGAVSCATQAVGLVYERNFARIFSAEGSAAPAIGTKGCVARVSANLYGAISAQPLRGAQVWVSAFRKLNDSEAVALTYENNAQGGWMQRFTPNTWMKTLGGWIGGTQTANTAPFRGTYAASMFGHDLPGGFTASFSFEYFTWTGLANVAPTRSLFVAGLYWSPNSSRADQTSPAQQNYGPMAH